MTENQIEKLGKGRYGDIFRIEKDSKIYMKEILNDDNILFPEVDIIKELDHPVCLKLHEYKYPNQEEGKKGYLIYEYMQNGTLSQIRQKKENTLNLSTIMITLYGIADCMNYVNNQKFLRCDLNLSNIFYDDKFQPHLSGFYFPSNLELISSPSIKQSFFNYNIPLVLNNQPNDVYNYGKLICSIFSEECQEISENREFSIPTTIPDFLKSIVEQCLDNDVSKRPSFLSICDFLKNTEELINVDMKSYHDYIKKIDDFHEITYKSVNRKKTGISVFFDEYINTIKSINCFNDKIKKGKKDRESSGGFGTVAEVQYPKGSGKSVAEKTLSPPINRCESINFLKIFFRETFNIFQTYHPCTLGLIGFDLFHLPQDGSDEVIKPHIAMDFCEYDSLEKSLKSSDPNDPRNNNFSASVRGNPSIYTIIVYGISRGFAYLHANNIKHRDIKGANILFDKLFHPHIADFGLSKQTDSDSLSVLQGSPLYIPPEVQNEGENYFSESDVYSVGLIFYEIFERHLYYFALNYAMKYAGSKGKSKISYDDKNKDYHKQVINYRINEEELPIFEITPEKYRDLIKKMLDPDIYNRPSMEEVSKFFENPENWYEGTDPEVFYNYKREIDIVEEKCQSKLFEARHYSMDETSKKYTNEILDDTNSKSGRSKCYKELHDLYLYQQKMQTDETIKKDEDKLKLYGFLTASSALASIHLFGAKEIPKDLVLASHFIKESQKNNKDSQDVIYYHKLLIEEIKKYEKKEIQLSDPVETFESINGRLLMGMYKEGIGESTDAMKLYLNSAIQGSIEAEGRAAILLYKNGRVDDAEQMLMNLRPWQNLDSDYIPNLFVNRSDESKICLFYLGLIKLNKGEIDKANQMFKKLFLLGFPNADNFLSICYFKNH